MKKTATTKVPMNPETTAPEAESFIMPIGFNKVRAMNRKLVKAHVETDKYGRKVDVVDQYHVVFVEKSVPAVKFDSVSGEVQNGFVLRFDATDKGLRKFAHAINRRSNFDLGQKLASIKLPINSLKLDGTVVNPDGTTRTHLDLILGYTRKYPVTMRYDFRQWVDQDSGDMYQTKAPVLFLWEASDFDKNDSGWAEIE